MSYIDLLDRIKGNDPAAFLEMTDRYGWSVYTSIRKKTSDAAVADKIYNETMNAFYRSLANASAEDPMEAILCTLADHIIVEQSCADGSTAVQDVTPPTIQLEATEKPVVHSVSKSRKKRSFGYKLCVLLLLLAIAAVIWCIAGQLMVRNIIPDYDLGYSWFNANVYYFF